MAECEHQRDRARRVAGVSKHAHRALNVVSTAFVGCCFPFPSFNFAFCSTEYQRVSGASNKMAKGSITEKSATFSFFFFPLLGMVGVADQGDFDRVRGGAPPGPLPRPNRRRIDNQCRGLVVGWAWSGTVFLHGKFRFPPLVRWFHRVLPLVSFYRVAGVGIIASATLHRFYTLVLPPGTRGHRTLRPLKASPPRLGATGASEAITTPANKMA